VAAAGTPTTPSYRVWSSKGQLVTAALVSAFGPLPPVAGEPRQNLAALVRWGADRVALPGVAAAFAGVFAEAVSDPDLRRLMRTQLQEPYRRGLEQALAGPTARALLIVDLLVGTLLHRRGRTGEALTETDHQPPRTAPRP